MILLAKLVHPLDQLGFACDPQLLALGNQELLIDQIAQKNYQAYRYFGVSALGETPTIDNSVSPRGIRPYRVGDPFTWMLSHFGTIPVEGG